MPNPYKKLRKSHAWCYILDCNTPDPVKPQLCVVICLGSCDFQSCSSAKPFCITFTLPEGRFSLCSVWLVSFPGLLCASRGFGQFFPLPHLALNMASLAGVHVKLPRPFFLFLDSQRDHFLVDYDFKDSKALGCYAGELWNGMSDQQKKPFYDEYYRRKEHQRVFYEEWQMALKEKRVVRRQKRQARVKRRLRIIRARVKQVVPKDEKLKQPKSGFMMFLNENRQVIRALLGHKPRNQDVCKKAAQLWKDLPAHDRKKWNDESSQQLEAWRHYLSSPEGQSAHGSYKSAKVAAELCAGPAGSCPAGGRRQRAAAAMGLD